MNLRDLYSMIAYKSDDDDGFIALCPEFPGVSAYGETRDAAIKELESVLEVVVADYADEGWDLPQPERLPDPALPSGEFRVRIPRMLHAELKRRAKQERVSINQLVTSYISRGLEASNNASLLVQLGEQNRWLAGFVRSLFEPWNARMTVARSTNLEVLGKSKPVLVESGTREGSESFYTYALGNLGPVVAAGSSRNG